MIYTTGHLTPQRHQIDEARVKADDSFCVGFSEEFEKFFPTFDGFMPDDTGILLKMKNVEPHEDDWVGGNVPKTRRALFWLLEGGGQKLVFGCGAKHIKMGPGDFVVFDDRKTHWVMSEKLWRAAAAQLRPIKKQRVRNIALVAR